MRHLLMAYIRAATTEPVKTAAEIGAQRTWRRAIHLRSAQPGALVSVGRLSRLRPPSRPALTPSAALGGFGRAWHEVACRGGGRPPRPVDAACQRGRPQAITGRACGRTWQRVKKT